MQNSKGQLRSGACCHGRQDPADGRCTTHQCETHFRVCLKEFQLKATAAGTCSFGAASTPVLGGNSFSPTGTEARIVLPFTFSWPVSPASPPAPPPTAPILLPQRLLLLLTSVLTFSSLTAPPLLHLLSLLLLHLLPFLLLSHFCCICLAELPVCCNMRCRMFPLLALNTMSNGPVWLPGRRWCQLLSLSCGVCVVCFF